MKEQLSNLELEKVLGGHICILDETEEGIIVILDETEEGIRKNSQNIRL